MRKPFCYYHKALIEHGDWIERLGQHPEIQHRHSDKNFWIEQRIPKGLWCNPSNFLYMLSNRMNLTVYQLGLEFSEALWTIPLKITPKVFDQWEDDYSTFWLDFPFAIPVSDADGDKAFIWGGLVTITRKPQGLALYDMAMYITFFAPIYDQNARRLPHTEHVKFSFRNYDKTIDDAVKRYYENCQIPPVNHLLEFMLNATVYIKSGDPDLRHLKVKRPHGTRDYKWYQRNENVTPTPTVRVGFGFKKPIQYSMDETVVTGHWRWQPCGESRKNVKLIWIDSHIRTYKKEG